MRHLIVAGLPRATVVLLEHRLGPLVHCELLCIALALHHFDLRSHIYIYIASGYLFYLIRIQVSMSADDLNVPDCNLSISVP